MKGIKQDQTPHLYLANRSQSGQPPTGAVRPYHGRQLWKPKRLT